MSPHKQEPESILLFVLFLGRITRSGGYLETSKINEVVGMNTEEGLELGHISHYIQKSIFFKLGQLRS